jgi:hypothetical protein
MIKIAGCVGEGFGDIPEGAIHMLMGQTMAMLNV